MHQVVAQIVQRLFFPAVGPEGSGQPGAFYGASMSQDEQGEEPFDGACTNAGQRFTMQKDAERSEQMNCQRGHRRFPYLYPPCGSTVQTILAYSPLPTIILRFCRQYCRRWPDRMAASTRTNALGAVAIPSPW